MKLLVKWKLESAETEWDEWNMVVVALHATRSGFSVGEGGGVLIKSKFLKLWSKQKNETSDIKAKIGADCKEQGKF